MDDSYSTTDQAETNYANAKESSPLANELAELEKGIAILEDTTNVLISRLKSVSTVELPQTHPGSGLLAATTPSSPASPRVTQIRICKSNLRRIQGKIEAQLSRLEV